MHPNCMLYRSQKVWCIAYWKHGFPATCNQNKKHLILVDINLPLQGGSFSFKLLVFQSHWILIPFVVVPWARHLDNWGGRMLNEITMAHVHSDRLTLAMEIPHEKIWKLWNAYWNVPYSIQLCCLAEWKWFEIIFRFVNDTFCKTPRPFPCCHIPLNPILACRPLGFPQAFEVVASPWTNLICAGFFSLAMDLLGATPIKKNTHLFSSRNSVPVVWL